MRYPNARNKALLFFLFCTALSCSTLQQKQTSSSLTGTWQYTGIYKKDTAIATLVASDTMILKENGQFRYDIAGLKKHKTGYWELIPSDNSKIGALAFTYDEDKSKRIFYICYLTGTELCIAEGDMQFRYTKRK